MSLVGTRPPTVDEWEQYELHHRSRMSTKPGITGMWQVSGRSDITDFEEVVRLDTEYIENWTIGLDSPPFRLLTEEEDKAVIGRINETEPDFVWVGLGAPKQERWMAVHQGKIDGLMIGVGAGFDYYAENIKRAPEWMQKSNLEWFYRLMQDPKRLFKRYLNTNTKFIWNAMIRGK